MKNRLLFSLFFFFGSTFLEAMATLPDEILNAIPAQYNLHDPHLKGVKQELEELVVNCGPGVIEGVSMPSPCSFKVKLNELFFEPEEKKTGLLHDKKWPYRESVTWFEPNATQEIPDNFDLRDLMKNGQPQIKKQQCGDCWAWATHHGLEITRAVHDGKVLDHSIQTVLSCSHAGSCSGGYMKAVDFLIHGLPLEPDFPYAASNLKCPYSSSDIQTGWEGKVISTPYVGNSLQYSRALRLIDGTFSDGPKVTDMMAALYQWKSPLVVTVSAYNISGNGVYDSCSAINSSGNHMVAIVGWEMWNGKRVAHVWNSWGPSHGENGISRIVWECGENKLNRGLGVSAKIVQYKECVPPNAEQMSLHEAKKGYSVTIGTAQESDTTCSWVPTEGLSNPISCVTTAKPNHSTEYHLTAQNSCGKSSSMTLVYLIDDIRKKKLVKTPYGTIIDPTL